MRTCACQPVPLRNDKNHEQCHLSSTKEQVKPDVIVKRPVLITKPLVTTTLCFFSFFTSRPHSTGSRRDANKIFHPCPKAHNFCFVLFFCRERGKAITYNLRQQLRFNPMNLMTCNLGAATLPPLTSHNPISDFVMTPTWRKVSK